MGVESLPRLTITMSLTGGRQNHGHGLLPEIMNANLRVLMDTMIIGENAQGQIGRATMRFDQVIGPCYR